MGAEVSRLGADRYSPGAILRFIAHIGKMSVGNISDGFRSALDTELERGKALAASAYQMHIGWRETSPEWTDFPWARAPAEGGSAEQVVCDWLEAVGLEPLPHGVAWNLLRIDSALLACWEEEEEEKASPAPLDNFPSYAEASDAVTPPSRPLHHPAWLPLALLMATTGEDANAWSIFPLNMLIAPPSVAAHFRLSKCARSRHAPLERDHRGRRPRDAAAIASLGKELTHTRTHACTQTQHARTHKYTHARAQTRATLNVRRRSSSDCSSSDCIGGTDSAS
mmetsp:Transcript_41539/g.135540  ORF Transcript_41539/g.135540 Transcript_41539/m.135540 type:complete len:281 (-) Transcript_41539:379-1221(-)